MDIRSSCTRLLAALAMMFGVVSPAVAQQATTSPIAVDSVVAFDEAVDTDGNVVPGVTVDTVASAGLGHGFEAIVRPWAQRLGSTREWNRQIWLATLRYERAGRVGLRIDSGLIPSPVGLANLMMRAPLNPTVAMPSSLFQSLPAIEPGGPRATLLGGLYPYGISGTVSMEHWDARASLIDTATMRSRRVFAQTNPPRFANVVLGGGVTPVIGLRVGGSFTRGGWQHEGEISPAALATAHEIEYANADYAEEEEHEDEGGGTSNANVVTLETEYAFRYTKFSGEWVRTARQTIMDSTVVASGWFVQGQQILSPRWFAAGRVERMDSPALLPSSVYVDQQFTGIESTIGYRLTPEVTLRAGHRARELFGRDTYAHTATFSVVWWQRWK